MGMTGTAISTVDPPKMSDRRAKHEQDPAVVTQHAHDETEANLLVMLCHERSRRPDHHSCCTSFVLRALVGASM